MYGQFLTLDTIYDIFKSQILLRDYIYGPQIEDLLSTSAEKIIAQLISGTRSLQAIDAHAATHHTFGEQSFCLPSQRERAETGHKRSQREKQAT